MADICLVPVLSVSCSTRPFTELLLSEVTCTHFYYTSKLMIETLPIHMLVLLFLRQCDRSNYGMWSRAHKYYSVIPA